MDPDLDSPGKELENAIKHLQPFYKEFKKVDLCESNHGLRMFKKARCTGLPQIVLRRYTEILKMPEGWKLFPDGLEIDGVYIFHGEGLSGGSWYNSHQKLKSSVVHGHLHSRGGVIYSKTRKHRQFVLNSGCLIDPRHSAFDYGKHSLEKPTIGCGVVIDGEEAYFIPMPSKWL